MEISTPRWQVLGRFDTNGLGTNENDQIRSPWGMARLKALGRRPRAPPHQRGACPKAPSATKQTNAISNLNVRMDCCWMGFIGVAYFHI